MTARVLAPQTPELVPTEKRPLRVECPTCHAQVGEPCDKRGNLLRGGPNHLTRAGRVFKLQFKHSGKQCARNWLLHSGSAVPVEWMVYQSTGVTDAQMRAQLSALAAEGKATETPDGWLWVDA